jgi:hypothetical protein
MASCKSYFIEKDFQFISNNNLLFFLLILNNNTKHGPIIQPHERLCVSKKKKENECVETGPERKI